MEYNVSTNMAQLPRLQDAALFSVIRKFWLTSNLPTLFARRAYQQYEGVYENEEELIDKIHNAFLDIRNKLIGSSELPRSLKVRIAAAWEHLFTEIEKFSYSLSCYVIGWRLKHMKYCLNRIIIRQTGIIDKKQTILNILSQPEGPEMSSQVLKEYDIGSSDLKYVLDKLKENNFKRRSLRRNCKEIPNCNTKIREILILLASPDLDLDQKWKQMSENRKNKAASPLQVAAELKNLEALKYFYNCLEENEKQKNLVETAIYVLRQSYISSDYTDIIVFLYDNMDDNLWRRILDSYYLPIFSSLIQSWRYRYLCLVFFKAIGNSISYQDFKKLYYSGIGYDDNIYSKYHIMTILEAIWAYSPIKLCETNEFITTILPRLVLSNLNFTQMFYFVKSFSRESQIETVSTVIVFLILANKVHLVPHCLDAVKCLNLNLHHHILTKSMLKMIIEKSPTIKFHCKSNMDKLVKIILKTDSAINLFREELSKDILVMSNSLDMITPFDDYNLIHWIFQDQINKISEWLEKRSKNHLLWLYVVNKIVSGKDYASSFSFYNFNSEVYKRVTTEYPDLVKKLLTCYLLRDRFNIYYYLNEFTNNYLPDVNIRAAWFKEYFNTDEGKRGLLQIILNLKSVEVNPAFRHEFIEDLNYYRNVVSLIVVPNGVNYQVQNILDEYGHPNARKQWEVRLNYREVRFWDYHKARRIVDARYRCFRSILQNPDRFPDFKQIITNRGDVTEVSLLIERHVGLEIPIVL